MTQAANYSIEKTTVDSVEVYIMRDQARATEVRIAPELGNNSYEMTVKGQKIFWSPYSSVGEFAAKPAHLGNPLLWPWANRIDGTTYYAAGRKYALDLEVGNVSPGPNNTPIHGLLVYSKLWKVKSSNADGRGASVTARLEFWRHPELMAQFPFAHNIEMTYRLADGALEVQTSVENLSVEPLPISLGYHPYFQLTDSPRDEWTVHLPAKDRLTLSSRLIPTGERTTNPYGDPLALQGVVLDDVFDGLVRDADGKSRFWVQGKKQRVTVEYGPKFGVAVVYAPRGRGFICFEPMTGPTNAFNAAHDGWYKGLQTVAPGGLWSESFRVVPSGY
nr:aldose 1-epimerase [uncultured Paludibaculum sp.]